MKKLTLALLVVLVAQVAAFAQASPTGFLDKTLTVDGKSYRYVVYVPRDYSADKKWPVALFLHGAGERGSDGLKQTQVGIGAAIRLYPERYPAIVVMPQCVSGQGWREGMAEMALKTLDKTMSEYSCDESRQYLTGLSMGGFGSWLIAAQHPKRFAAVVPICGRGDAATGPALKDLPIWAFHGDADQAVPVSGSRTMVEAIKAAGGTLIKYTEYPSVGHNSWDPAYSDKAMAEWLFAQKR
jgi:predicted peptidase